MQAEQQTLNAADHIAAYQNDTRPAWLWSADGRELLWANAASMSFAPKARRKTKAHSKKTNAVAKPIGGQIARALRLGAMGRPSLSRMQFTVGKRPVSATCTCTPLVLVDNSACLLVVGVDPIEGKFDEGALPTANLAALGLLDNQSITNSDAADAAPSPEPGEQDDPQDESDHGLEVESDSIAEATANDVKPDQVEQSTQAETPNGGLVGRFDSLASDQSLFAPLDEEDDALEFTTPTLHRVGDTETSLEQNAVTASTDHTDTVDETVSAPIELDEPDTQVDEAHIGATPSDNTQTDTLWRLEGRGFVADQANIDVTGSALIDTQNLEEQAPDVQDSAEPVEIEQTTRYNFEELSRILTDRVGGEEEADVQSTSTGSMHPSEPKRGGGDLVNLGDENLILNRLPLGLLVFRDQQVLFANRALVDLLDYPDVASLRDAGLASVFPGADDDNESVGPIDQLRRRDGDNVTVSARLQTISWRGRSALLLSARSKDVPENSGGSIGAAAPIDPNIQAASMQILAEDIAKGLDAGFLELSRAGVINQASDKAAELLRRSPQALTGRPIQSLVHPSQTKKLRTFLEQPARFAGQARPSLVLETVQANIELMLLAEGRAGVVSGYLAFVRPNATKSEQGAIPDAHVDTALLGRLSRGVRRPLNTIIGFAELIRSGATGKERSSEYARDIGSAGQEIAGLVDELDDYARLRGGSYTADNVDLELSDLLDHCVARVRGQAGAARVFVRSAISETLPRIKADRASLAQAILNLLASAIDQSPAGGHVVVSAQREQDGSIGVHVRDSAATRTALEERFVVFREDADNGAGMIKPIRSTVGLALTRSLLAINACSLSFDPASGTGTLVSLIIPADLIVD